MLFEMFIFDILCRIETFVRKLYSEIIKREYARQDCASLNKIELSNENGKRNKSRISNPMSPWIASTFVANACN